MLHVGFVRVACVTCAHILLHVLHVRCVRVLCVTYAHIVLHVLFVRVTCVTCVHIVLHVWFVRVTCVTRVVCVVNIVLYLQRDVRYMCGIGCHMCYTILNALVELKFDSRYCSYMV